MYFWNVDAIKRELSEGTLSEAEKFIYAFVVLVNGAINLEIIRLTSQQGSYNLIRSLFHVAVVIIGLIGIYRANGGAEGKNFFERFICLSFFVYLRVVLINFMLTLAFIFLGFYMTSIEVLVSVFFYWYVAKLMADIREGKIGGEKAVKPSMGKFVIATASILLLQYVLWIYYLSVP